jgi:hypothetical protein
MVTAVSSALTMFGGGMAKAQEVGLIGRTFEDGLPVVYRLVDELPTESARAALPWLTVISWSYDGSSHNGMPAMSVNDAMVRLERAMENALLRDGVARHAYSRTGNGLKEFVYYVSDRDEFIAALNDALSSHSKYPIEITFYHDPEWKDFRDLLEVFRQDN